MANNKKLPPLQALAYFESAARHLSFTGASVELGTSQPAVSQRINALEADLGVALFSRKHRGVALTMEGEQLFQIVSDSLHNIRQETEKLRKRQQKNQLLIDTDMGFATYWLLPRLESLQLLMPDIEIQISTSPQTYNFRESPADLAISFGDGHWPGCHADKLFPELVVPVCSPAFIEEYGAITSIQQMSELPLLSLPENTSSRWMSWHDWFLANGFRVENKTKSTIFNAYSLVIQAALQGRGIALGWLPLVSDVLEQGSLVLAGGRKITTERGYYLIQPNDHLAPVIHEKVKNWIITEAFVMRNTKKAYTKKTEPI